MDEIYVSVDIECDGPCPGLHSMLSIGAAALDPSRGIGRDAVIGTWTANLEALPGARPDPDTMKWWATQPKAWEACRARQTPIVPAMEEFAGWLEALPAPPIFVGYPAGFDFTFVYYYLHRFAGRNPFVRNAIDMETYVMALTGSGYLETGRRSWPEHWFDRTLPHTHVALDDAIAQGVTFLRILSERRGPTWGAAIGGEGCPVCAKPGGPLIDGPHTYGGNCGRRRMR